MDDCFHRRTLEISTRQNSREFEVSHIENPRVGGSIPPQATKKINDLAQPHPLGFVVSGALRDFLRTTAYSLGSARRKNLHTAGFGAGCSSTCCGGAGRQSPLARAGFNPGRQQLPAVARGNSLQIDARAFIEVPASTAAYTPCRAFVMAVALCCWPPCCKPSNSATL